MTLTDPTNKELTDEEKGTIIEEVRVREAIWDSSNANHSKRNVINELYEQIAKFMTKSTRKITGNVIVFSITNCNLFRQSRQRCVD